MNQWVKNYEGVSGDRDMIPTMGIRVLCGIGARGEKQFYVSIDGEGSDPIGAAFMLELARDKMKEVAVAGYSEQVERRSGARVEQEREQGA